MAAHAFSASVSLTKELVELVPELNDKIKAGADGNYPPAWSCTNGCDWIRILGCSFWVDFTAKVIATDTSNLPCGRAAIAAGGAISAATTDGDKREVRHGRLDISSVYDKFVRPKDLSVQAQAATHDADLMAEIDADRVLVMKSPEKIPAANLLTTLRVVGMQAGEHVTALTAGMCAQASLKPDDLVNDQKIQAGMYIDTATGDLGLKMIHKKVMMLMSAQRGLLEIADYASLMHRTMFSSINFGAFMTALHTLYRKEIHEVTDTIGKLDNAAKDLSVLLDHRTRSSFSGRTFSRAMPAHLRPSSGRSDSAS